MLKWDFSRLSLAHPGVPVVGDYDGDGRSDLAVFGLQLELVLPRSSMAQSNPTVRDKR